MENDKIYICLANGKTFEGKRFGADGDVIGELVFNTASGGFAKILNDGSNYKKIVLQTFPLVGNYGCSINDINPNVCAASAYIVREHCSTPSNFKSEITISEFLKKNHVVGVYDVDTREITKILRDGGAMNAMITSSLENIDFEKIKAFKSPNGIEQLSVKKPVMKGSLKHTHNVVLLDCGASKTEIEKLAELECNVAVLPWNTKAESILKLNPDGIVISDGPYSDDGIDELIAEIKKLIGEKPIMAIGLGHLLLALSLGGKIKKMKNGHRGTNQPVRDCKSERTYITSQNHGYEVDNDSIKNAEGEIILQNANDNSCEGIEYRNSNAFSVSFNPEAANDTEFIYNKFINMMEGTK